MIDRVNLQFWALLVTLHIVTGNLVREDCQSNNFKKVLTHHEDFIVYGLTQDCQLFFARAEQLPLLNHLRVQPRVTYCLPELVQLHWRELHTSGSIGLELVFKRPNHQICVLPLEFPAKHAFHGNALFSYSISNAMHYARCSYITNSSFVMEPDLSFMDSSFGDVIYFADPQSSGSFWTIRQFKLDRDGLRHSLETFIVKNYAESHKHRLHSHRASEYLLELDAQRRKLHAVHRQNKHATSVCVYDLLFKWEFIEILISQFRPHKAHLREHLLEAPHNHAHKFRINSFSADANISLFGEYHQISRDQFSTRIKVADLSFNNSAVCLFELPYLVEVGFIREKSLEDLKFNKLPAFSHHLIPKKEGEVDRKTHPHHQHNTHEPPIRITNHHKTTKPAQPTTPKTATTPIISSPTPQKTIHEHSDKKIKDVEAKILEPEEDSQSNELGFLTEITTKEISKDRELDKAEAGGEASGEQDETENILRSAAEQNMTTEGLNRSSIPFPYTPSTIILIIVSWLYL